MPRARRRPLAYAFTLSMVFLLSTSMLPVRGAATEYPSLRLLAPASEIDVVRFPDQPIRFDPGVYLGSVGGAFEIRAKRKDYDEAPEVQQVVRRSTGTTRRALPSWVAPDLAGIRGLLHVEVRDADGNVVKERNGDFCPDGADMRVSDSGPRVSRYPRACTFGPFAQGVVWGIEKAWAISAFGWQGVQFPGGEGRYTVRISIAPRYVALFGVRDQDAARQVRIRVTDYDCGPDGCGEGAAPAAANPRRHDHATHDHATHDHGQLAGGHADDANVAARRRGPLGVVRTLANPTADAMPDLVALPAWNIQLAPQGERDHIAFSATVWNSGPSPLLVEGYRRDGEAVMDAWQYFMRGNEVVGRRRAGALEYDTRAGHLHWHFKQFATYSLLNESKSQVVLSRKEAFCLAPTDAIDMTVRGATWQPGSTGLGTACGNETSIWIRETLEAGWGDTYGQFLPGQALNITDLPNGTYFVAVEANVRGLLMERSTSNNRALRRIVLGGTPGARTLRVAPWHGIDA